MPRLLLINGPPGAGKSTVARRYLDDHPLTLLVEVDELRTSMGAWAARTESKLLARSLALALARTHLGAGHDVVVPQYLGRAGFVTALASSASDTGATFRHVLLVDDEPALVARFRRRRHELADAGLVHPETDVTDDGVEAVVAEAVRRLQRLASDRSDVLVIRAAGSPDATYRSILDAIDGAR